MSSMDLSSIVVNHATRPPRVVVYGEHKIGKSTFAASAPAPIVIRTEDGLAAIQVPTFPLATSYDEVLQAISTLYAGGHPFQTVVLDTLDWLEPLVWTHTAERDGKRDIEDIGYGKGYIKADEYWREVLDGLNALNDQGMTVICLAHAEIKRFDAPDTEAYDRYQIKLHKRAAAIIQEWADVIAFARHEIVTVSEDVGFNKKNTRGVSLGTRVLSVEERPAYYAGNRYSLPPDLPFPKAGAWQIFADACAPAFTVPAPLQLNLTTPPAGSVETDADRRMGDKVEALFGDEIREIAEAAKDASEEPVYGYGSSASDIEAMNH